MVVALLIEILYREAEFFPPGVTHCSPTEAVSDRGETCATRSPWKEFEFWASIVKTVIEPKIPIEQAIDDWPQIRRWLMERPRKRQLQNDIISAQISTFLF